MGGRRYALRIGGAVMVVALALAVPVRVFALASYHERSNRIGGHGCGDGPLGPEVRPDTFPSAFLYPYGATLTCRELDREPRPFGSVDGSVYLLLDTDAGAVAIRVDYSDMWAGWQWQARAWELSPDEVESLVTPEELRLLREAVAARGGIEQSEWIIHYGDG